MRPVTVLAYAIRFAALTFGCVIILASMPLAILAATAPSDVPPSVSPLLLLPAAALVLASGFLYIGVLGRRMAKHGWHYLVAGVLLCAPLGGGIWLLNPPNGPEWQPVGLLFAVPAALLFVCAVWPLRVTSISR